MGGWHHLGFEGGKLWVIGRYLLRIGWQACICPGGNKLSGSIMPVSYLISSLLAVLAITDNWKYPLSLSLYEILVYSIIGLIKGLMLKVLIVRGEHF